MKILITGSGGLVGKEIASQLAKNKKNNLILLSNKKIKKKNLNFFYQNLLNPIKLNLNPEIIIHCAAKHPNSNSGSDMKNIYSTNIKITKNLIKFANKNKVKLIFFLSSVAVYGHTKNKMVAESQKPVNPNLYEKSKLLSEKLFLKKENKFQTICLRIPGIFTLSLNKNYPLVIKTLKKINKNERIKIYNPSGKFNNVLDTKEIVKFINYILIKKIKKCVIFNFSATSPIQFIKIINLMKKIFHSKSKIISEISNNKNYIISNSKIFKELNFESSTTREIIGRCCKSVLKKIIK